MKFRPCIDIHNGKVKQIIGGSLLDQGNYATDNFVSEKNGDYYARLYRHAGLAGGHIILLNPEGSRYYEEDVKQACLALEAFPGGLQIGGGMTAENASFFLEKGASHIIVTSYVFKDGRINYDNLKKIVAVTGKDRLVLDLSCRKKGDDYYVVTDRWQKFTREKLTEKLLTDLSLYCDEFLIHAVDVEGKAGGIEEKVAALLGDWEGIPVTYAGGVGSFEDLRILKRIGRNRVDVTIGSALDLFGGTMNFEKVLEEINQ
ncbi:MAG: phosphoribosylformimino-5-aminoimidazole carboxamide ribotide isomerase [Eubacterium sp.]|nr:phosphoribosylformimino-5-aminoimidazole carboxamide ribotide isomerase [Eubacterium sp.]MDD7208483.1 phosphoribosylformimino-5-aminoimidazole carboxamide ribotide isomerase [Lachnospiraceae bacterium]MDY5497606.1 phosphoribosylformimino-5-aminoimidazole carboxamide ribotide isomerase [Anaerobutyricum sp.]